MSRYPTRYSLWGIGVHGDSIRSTFNKIDKDRKGHITEADLQQFAEAHNLPRSYVKPFLDAVLQQQQQQQQPHLSSSEDESEGEVGYAAFREFVVSREAGLREALANGDGHISAEDLHASLARVSICSPRSRCVLRTSQDVVGQLLARIDMDGSRRLSFGEFRRFFMLLPQQGQLVEYWLSGPAALQCADMGGHFSILERNRHSGAPWGERTQQQQRQQQPQQQAAAAAIHIIGSERRQCHELCTACHLLAGAVAGATSRSATAPLETLRLAAMAGALPPGSSLLSAAQGLVAQGGAGALFRGNLVNVMRSAPARAVDFLAFDLFKSWLGSDTNTKTFAAAGLAGTLSWALLYPLEVVRSRVTLGPAQRYSGLRHCVASIARQEGLGAFYRGLGPSLLAIAPEAAITYG
ncbi:mitochondrial carrier domain-containing protein [Scenedesmus sp. NREL 46B-D3]|nr:mitochondrial carrier domain-containing protein [Scenedesmus sp. NREL 46B-D3]